MPPPFAKTERLNLRHYDAARDDEHLGELFYSNDMIRTGPGEAVPRKPKDMSSIAESVNNGFVFIVIETPTEPSRFVGMVVLHRIGAQKNKSYRAK